MEVVKGETYGKVDPPKLESNVNDKVIYRVLYHNISCTIS